MRDGIIRKGLKVKNSITSLNRLCANVSRSSFLPDRSSVLYRLKVLLTFFVFLAVTLSVPALIRPQIPLDPAGERTQLIDLLREVKPAYIFIGNSMVVTRIDPTYCSKLTHENCLVLWKGGVMSSVWYLMLKNIIIPSGVRPKAIFIFFRDTELTEPRFRTGYGYKKMIEDFSTDHEPILSSLLDTKKPLSNQILDRFYEIYPLLKVIQLKSNISASVTIILNDIRPQRLPPFDIKQLNRIFDSRNHKRALTDGENVQEDYTFDYDFEGSHQKSFLPAIIQLSESNSLRLVFIRVQRRPLTTSPPIQTKQLLDYIKNLKSHLFQHGCFFHDFTGDPEITLDMYGTGDHIHENHIKRYTEIFFNRINAIVQ